MARLRPLVLPVAVLLIAATPNLVVVAQTTGSIVGTITSLATGAPLPLANVVVRGTTMGAATNEQGRYEIKGVPPGVYSVVVRMVGHMTAEVRSVKVEAGKAAMCNASLADEMYQVGDVTVYGASRRAERLTDAPAAVTALQPAEIKLQSSHGQLPRLLENVPGVDIAQSGVYDFNLNTRGFNSSLNRRVLVLLDGRDMATAFLGAVEWNAFTIPLDDIGRVELVRGPGSALYGPNAFNGVFNISTPSPREVLGTKVTLSGGGLTLIRGDVRHAGIIDDQWSFKVNLGRVQSTTWSKSRTLADTTARGEFEYDGLRFDRTVTPARSLAEVRPLDPDALTSVYGTVRFDYEPGNGSALTFEGGRSVVKNEIIVTGIGRVQIPHASRPWGRINYHSDRLNIMLWGQGRISVEPQYSLASGAALQERSWIANAEIQYNFLAFDDRLRIVVGGAERIYNVDTEGTLMAEEKREQAMALFGQAELEATPWLKVVAASRLDYSSLHARKLSPKAAIVLTPLSDHVIRATYNEAFQVANFSEFFLTAAAGTADVPFFASPTNPGGTIPVLARGNKDLEVENIKGVELGYKGMFFAHKLFITLDGYYNQLDNFTTDLLQGVNPAFPFAVPPGFPAGLVEVARQQIPGLTIVDGSPAVVISYTNAGKVEEYGTELGVNYYITKMLRAYGSWTWYDFKVKEKRTGDVLLPNAPKHKFAGGLGLRDEARGFDVDVNARHVQAFRWAAGIFQGDIKEYTIVNLSGGYQMTENYRIGVHVSNLLDHQVYQLFGGSVIGRQIIGSITATF